MKAYQKYGLTVGRLIIRSLFHVDALHTFKELLRLSLLPFHHFFFCAFGAPSTHSRTVAKQLDCTNNGIDHTHVPLDFRGTCSLGFNTMSGMLLYITCVGYQDTPKVA